jgi:hypothetical protein
MRKSLIDKEKKITENKLQNKLYAISHLCICFINILIAEDGFIWFHNHYTRLIWKDW